MFDLLVVGGGAAGFYGAIHLARQVPGARIAILEQNREFLSKVRISGGGRCNLCHRPLEPAELASHYPRGSRELLGPFHSHAARDVMGFFEGLGVALKTESDGRVFPVSDRSETIISHLLAEAAHLGIELHPGTRVRNFKPAEVQGQWLVETSTKIFHTRNLLVSPGSSRPVWNILESLGHQVVPPVPSLFTFRIDDPRLEGLQGVSAPALVAVHPNQDTEFPTVQVNFRKLLRSGQLQAEGPALITHWGLSGPAVLRLSAWGARLFAALGYRFRIRVNWLPDINQGSLPELLAKIAAADASKVALNSRAIPIPGRLWARLVRAAAIPPDMRWAEVSRSQLQALSDQLSHCELEVRGKSTFKEEFVTAGGVSLREVNFKTFESRKLPGLFLAGEVMDVDAITGGFNFQSAWTGGYLAARGIAIRIADRADQEG